VADLWQGDGNDVSWARLDERESYLDRRDMITMYGISTRDEGGYVLAGDAELGQVLRMLREAKGISVTSAAQALGTERHATVSEIEGGKRKATFAEVVKLAALYGVSVSDVVQDFAGEGASCSPSPKVAIALPRAEGRITEEDRLALARLERAAGDYAGLKLVLDQ
jgi:transcriptional regulator with XRE-family HTH domain